MYTILDTETASLQGGVVELALLHLDDNLEVIGEYHTRVNPERPIEPGAFAVHGISDAEVANSPKLGDLSGHLIPITHVIGHNCGFDLRMLKGHIDPTHSLCTLALARQYVKGTTNHKLETLQRELNLPKQKSHSALGDVYTTLDLLRHILPLTGTTVEALFSRAAKPKMVNLMPWGRYKGTAVALLPADYRTWMTSLPDLDKDLRYTLEKLA
jgi:exodeoxyribonuclease X